MTGIPETELDHKMMVLCMAISQARARRQREHPDWPQDAISDEDLGKIIDDYERCTGLADPSATITKLRANLMAMQRVIEAAKLWRIKRETDIGDRYEHELIDALDAMKDVP